MRGQCRHCHRIGDDITNTGFCMKCARKLRDNYRAQEIARRTDKIQGFLTGV